MRTCVFVVCLLATGGMNAAGDELTALVKASRDAVVRIEVVTPKGPSLGSGFVVRDDGLIATNHHVIADAASGKVIFEDGRSFDIVGLVVSRDDHDMVLLKVEAGEKLPVLQLCGKEPDQGEEVFTFGNPKGLRFVVSRGVVSAIADTFEIARSDEALGRELLATYSRDAVWVQTDAPISGGNSGGPLINMRGEVVGINTWHRMEGQNLNFAGSAVMLGKMLKLAANKPAPLPGARPGMVAAERPRAWSPIQKIELPDGKILDLSIFERPAAAFMSDRDSEDVLRIPYPDSSRPFATLRLKNGKLHGVCGAQHENGEPMVVGRYEEGSRDGPFRWMSPDGDTLLDAQFNLGKEHGLVCYYQSGRPALVLECTNGKTQRSHRLEDDVVVESSTHAPAREIDASETTRKLLHEYGEFARQLRKNEYAIKQLVRDMIDDIRKQRAAARGAWTTQMMLQRINARAAQDAAVINSLRQKSGF